MKIELLNKYRKAIELNGGIAVTRADAYTHKGFPTEYFEFFGLTKRDLKCLEKLGCALRGHTKNEWRAGETLPSGKVVGVGELYRGAGTRTRWVLLRGSH